MTFVRQPTRAGVRDADAKLAETLPPTPLFTTEIKGVTVALKAESLQPVGAFKVRGAWHRLTALDADALVIATGGPSIPKMGATGIAYDLARQFGLKVVEPRPALVPCPPRPCRP